MDITEYSPFPNINFYEYLSQQSGSGISNGHAGDRFHVGNGFFGTLIEMIPKALKYISRYGWEGAKEFGSAVMNGQPLEKAGKSALTKTAQAVLDDAGERLKKFKGSGYKRRKRKTKAVKKPKKRKTKVKTVKKRKKVKKKVYKQKIVSSNYI